MLGTLDLENAKKNDGYLPINIVQFDKPAFTSENSNDERQQIKV